jgi:hypothetical protein
MTDEVSPNEFAGASPEADSDPFISDLAAALRVNEEVSSAFEWRVMAAVRQEAAAAVRRANARAWWRRRSIHLTPVGALALAASLAAVAYVGAGAVDGPGDPASSETAVVDQDSADNREIVRFVFVDPEAHDVVVVGSFNQWRKDATPLVATGVPGVWAVSVPLETGRHEYAFVVDGEKWSPDPFAPAIRDEFGTESSIVRIGQASTSS